MVLQKTYMIILEQREFCRVVANVGDESGLWQPHCLGAQAAIHYYTGEVELNEDDSLFASGEYTIRIGFDHWFEDAWARYEEGYFVAALALIDQQDSRWTMGKGNGLPIPYCF